VATDDSSQAKMNKTGQPVKIKSGLIFVVKTIPILALQGKIREAGDLKHIVKLVPRGVTHPMASTLQDLVTSEPGHLVYMASSYQLSLYSPV